MNFYTIEVIIAHAHSLLYANTHIHNVTVTNCNTLHGEEERSGRTGKL